MEAKTLQVTPPVGSFKETVRRKHERQKQLAEENAKLQAEAERAKEDPFYQRERQDTACEPAHIPQPDFKRGHFMNAIRKQRTHQQEWQEQINRKLDEREEQHRIAMEKWQPEMEEA